MGKMQSGFGFFFLFSPLLVSVRPFAFGYLFETATGSTCGRFRVHSQPVANRPTRVEVCLYCYSSQPVIEFAGRLCFLVVRYWEWGGYWLCLIWWALCALSSVPIISRLGAGGASGGNTQKREGALAVGSQPPPSYGFFPPPPFPFISSPCLYPSDHFLSIDNLKRRFLGRCLIL